MTSIWLLKLWNNDNYLAILRYPGTVSSSSRKCCRSIWMNDCQLTRCSRTTGFWQLVRNLLIVLIHAFRSIYCGHKSALMCRALHWSQKRLLGFLDLRKIEILFLSESGCPNLSSVSIIFRRTWRALSPVCRCHGRRCQFLCHHSPKGAGLQTRMTITDHVHAV